MTKEDDQKNCPECGEEGRNMMLSLEDIFGDSIREMRERDKEFLPKTEWFSRIETDLDTFMQTYMTKYRGLKSNGTKTYAKAHPPASDGCLGACK
ncbi:hypothetical protein FGF01_01080 [Aeromonas salmonicida subsp. achromogenes]|uniref:hypothetical protein n=1 Tax=Aeromonas salmonicida TaxID=645 RepID=UPI000551D646|nr:hypothetical protein [Aeromonas salmonicida]TMX14314.1 hypothetical protein FGF01_01080 [Aeromonas salmonicida subsp. achromogenes]TMX17960.1 hypothetical protein FGE99_01255 [Aeromonas salmonicida subsp. achromogenes]TMX18708.1 hypothetical protein FGF02_00610 [Aeromonas salmonicida subsp. achromogenes]TMX21322.1 hypothetical protein FGF00_01050 [Aeromonas salmonicida subsp. achromogenes]